MKKSSFTGLEGNSIEAIRPLPSKRGAGYPRMDSAMRVSTQVFNLLSFLQKINEAYICLADNKL